MTVQSRASPLSPFWSETRLTSGRGNVGTGMFERVFFVELLDGPQGEGRVRNLTLSAGGAALSQVISTGHEIALEDDLSAMLLLPQAGRIFCAMGARDLVAHPGQAMILPRGRRRTVTRRDGGPLFRALALRLADPVAGSPLANGATLDLRTIGDLAEAATLMVRLSQPSAAPRDVLETQLRGAQRLIDGALAGLVPESELPLSVRRADRALRRAEALLREDFAEDVSIREVADRAGLSMRQMQHLFAHAHGLSPHAWLTRLRLEQAHLRLKSARPAPSVTDVALSVGLAHLGRFPAQYRARFGTLPSVARATQL